MNQIQKKQMDEAILSEHKSVGDVARLAAKFGVSRVYILQLINNARLSAEQAKAAEYAQAVMRAGQCVYALPANQLQTVSGSNAIVIALEDAIKKAGNNSNVLISISIVPVQEIKCSEAVPFERPHHVAASLQARSINHKGMAVCKI